MLVVREETYSRFGENINHNKTKEKKKALKRLSKTSLYFEQWAFEWASYTKYKDEKGEERNKMKQLILACI